MSKKTGSKRKVKCTGLNPQEIEEIKTAAFDLFANESGLIDIKEIKNAMTSLGFNTKSPTIFKIIEDLDTEENQKNGGVDFDTFINELNQILMDRNHEDSIGTIFDLFLNDPKKDVIDYKTLKEAARTAEKETGMKYSDAELKRMLHAAATSNDVIDFDDFYNLMTRKGA